MSSNFVVNVPKLKGKENYDDWAFAAANLLVLEGMCDYIKKEIPDSDTVGVSLDAKAKAKLILTIDTSLYVHIKEAKTTKELWMKLKALFDDSGFSRRITLLRHLISIRLESCETMTSYVTQIVETSQRLSGTGFVINDEWIGSLLLAGLPERFSPMIMAIEHSGIPITADTIKTKLLDMGAAEVSEAEYNSAFVVKTHKKTGKGSNTSKSGRSNVKVTGGKNITCYKCKETGHYRNQCPLLNENTEKKKQTNAFNVVFLSGNFCKSDWYIDSGASMHMTVNQSWIQNASCSSSLPEIIVANKTKVPVSCVGDVEITSSYDYQITVKNVLCVPNLTTNLLSVSELIKNGNNVIFESNRCLIYNAKGDLVADSILKNGVYKLNLKEESSLLVSLNVDGELWHRRLGHLNSTDMNKMKHGLVEGLDYPDNFITSKTDCEICCEGKQSRLPFSKGTRATEVLQIVHADVCGAMETKSIGGAQYFLLFVDDFSRMTFIYFMKHKSEVFHWFKNFKAVVENQKNKRIKILRTDNGGEFCSGEMNSYLAKEGIIHQKTNAYTPEQNGVCERANRTVVEKARCLLFEADLDKRFWAEAANTAVYLKNRSAASGLEKTPYELWTGTRPNLGHVRIFGSSVMVHVPKEKRLKWDKKAKRQILVGFSENVKGYRIYDPCRNLINTSRDVVITELPSRKNRTSGVTLENADSVEEPPEVKELLDKSSSSETNGAILENTDSVGETPEVQADDDNVQEKEQEENLEETRRQRRPPQRYGYANVCTTPPIAGEMTYAEAISGPEGDQWMQAMADELQSFQENHVWEVVDTPVDASVVQCKWVLKKKVDSDNNVRYRARLVAKGYTQIAGVDYEETFSPVIRHSTLRLLFALSVQLNMNVTHLDVTTAFLNGNLKENIYMCLPEGFSLESSDKKVLKLKKAVYGLKQSSLAWYQKVSDTLHDLGYCQSKLEPCVYTKNHSNNEKTVIGIYVDDFLIFSNNNLETEFVIKALSSKFKIKNLGQVKQYLGMRINMNKNLNCVTLDQQNYIEQLAKRFDMADCKGAATPIESKLNLEKSESCDSKLPYQRLLGSLMYLAVLTRPDIAYSVSYLSQFNNTYSHIHWNYAKRILKYLMLTKDYCLRFTKERTELEGYVDADWGSDSLDRRSYTGFCFLKSGSAISWESKKQRTVALSTCEAEYMALSEACREAIYLRNLEAELTGSLRKVSLYNDSQSALKLANNHQSHKRSKHIDVRYNFIREVIANGVIEAKYLSTSDMPADLLTKGLNEVKHRKFMKALGIVKK